MQGPLLSFPSGLWMVDVIACCVLDGCYYFLVGSGWFLLLPVHTFWHIASLQLEEMFGRKEDLSTSIFLLSKKE